MRKLSTFLSILALSSPVLGLAQGPKKVASPAQVAARSTFEAHRQQRLFGEPNSPLLAAKPNLGIMPQALSPNGKTAAVTPVMLGTATNGFTSLLPYQNQVLAVDSLGLVAFIHRQDVNIFGGGGTENGKYRYDLSTDGGLTFNNDIGPLQTTYTNYGRYPQISAVNPSNSSNPFDSKFAWYGPTNRFPTPGWLAHVNGLSNVVSASPTTSTEHYQFDLDEPLLAGGLCQGQFGEYWTVTFKEDGNSVITDTMLVMKGTYNSATQDLEWVIAHRLAPGYDRSYDGDAYGINPNIAFSPDGQYGWISILGNIGNDPKNDRLWPVFFRSTDGGDTWSSAIEVDLDQFAWVKDSLQSLWVDSTMNPASSGDATVAFDADITVDEYGDVHMGVVVGTAAAGFSISSGLAKFLADVHSVGGTGWDISYISPILTFRGEFGGGSQPLTQDNFPQVSRDEKGRYVFFSWVDSDTSQFTGSQNGIGFSIASNDAPNLRIGVRRVIDGAMVYPKLITDGDLIWEGLALVPTMAPIVYQNGSRFHLPIVMLEMMQQDLSLQCRYWYFGGDAYFDFSTDEWCNAANMDLGWYSWGYPGATPPCAVSVDQPAETGVILHQSYPNPATNEALVRFVLPSAMNVQMELVNMYGQRITTLAAGEMAAGAHDIQIKTDNLAAGIYFYSLHVNGTVMTKKMVVTK